MITRTKPSYSPNLLLLTLSALLVFAPFSAHAEEPPPKHKESLKLKITSTFDSKTAYLQSQGRPFRELRADRLIFRDANGDAVRELPVSREEKGKERGKTIVERKPIPTVTGAVVVISKYGYEWEQQQIEIYSENGKLLGRTPQSLSIVGFNSAARIFVVAERDSENNVNGTFSFYDHVGKKLADHTLFLFGGQASYIFSEDGSYGAVLMDAYPARPNATGGIAIFDAKGLIVSKHDTEAWRPLSSDAQDDASRPLARLDAQNKMVIAVGYKPKSADSYLYAVDFSGRFAWKYLRKGDSNICPATFALNASKRRIQLAELCPGELRINEFDVLSGAVQRSTVLPIRNGKATNIRAETTSDGSKTLVSFSVAGEVHTIVFGNALSVLWQEKRSASSKHSYSWSKSGELIVWDGSKIHLGTLEK